MFKFLTFISFLFLTTKLSKATQDSFLLSHYDLKVRNNEPSCRLVGHANLPEDRRTLAGRGCMCDEECIRYKDCCKDSVYYRPNEQSLPPSHHCSETTGVYVMAKCPEEWDDNETRELCEKSTQTLENEDISMILPISNLKTRQVYGNRFCAACNNDADTNNWIQFPMGVACGEAPPGYLKRTLNEVEYLPPNSNPPSNYPSNSYNLSPNILPPTNEKFTTNEFEKENCNHSCRVKVINNIITQPSPSILLDIHLYIYNDTLIDGQRLQWPVQLKTVVPTVSESFSNGSGRNKRDSKNVLDFKKYSSKAETICSNAKYDKENKEFVSEYDGKSFICRFGPLLPENSTDFSRRCVPFLERQCPNDFENDVVKEECAIHTNIVYNKKSKKPYRNKDCARCNGEKEESVDGTPQDTRADLGKNLIKPSSTGADGSQSSFKPSKRKRRVNKNSR